MQDVSPPAQTASRSGLSSAMRSSSDRPRSRRHMRPSSNTPQRNRQSSPHTAVARHTHRTGVGLQPRPPPLEPYGTAAGAPPHTTHVEVSSTTTERRLEAALSRAMQPALEDGALCDNDVSAATGALSWAYLQEIPEHTFKPDKLEMTGSQWQQLLQAYRTGLSHVELKPASDFVVEAEHGHAHEREKQEQEQEQQRVMYSQGGPTAVAGAIPSPASPSPSPVHTVRQQQQPQQQLEAAAVVALGLQTQVPAQVQEATNSQLLRQEIERLRTELQFTRAVATQQTDLLVQENMKLMEQLTSATPAANQPTDS